ncbi:MAG: TSUP family transporter, partial [Ethanoligenens sp.]
MSGVLLGCLAGFLSGFIGGLGLGGGGVLVLFLTLFAGVGQLRAQGINLAFFIPVGLFALIFHVRNRLVDFKIAWPAILLGLGGAAVGSMIASHIGAWLVGKLFGALLLALGAWEVFAPHK